MLLLEAGGRDWHPYIHIPLGMGKMHEHAMFDWGYETEPEPNLNGRRIEAMRGKVLGGSSSINVMAYTRGNRGDYDRWAQKGARGWSYADVLPYFRRNETFGGRREHLARRRRAARHRVRQDQGSALRRLDRGRQGGRLSRQPGLQRQDAGRLRPQPVHHSQRPPLILRHCLSQAGAGAGRICDVATDAHATRVLLKARARRASNICRAARLCRSRRRAR